MGEGALVGLGGGGLLEYQNQRLAQTISMASCLISNPGTLQIRIQFIRQRNNPTLEQTNKQTSKPRVLYQKEQQTTVAVHLEKFWGHGSHFKCGVANILKLKLAFFIDVCPAAATCLRQLHELCECFKYIFQNKIVGEGGQDIMTLFEIITPIYLFLPFFKEKKFF